MRSLWRVKPRKPTLSATNPTSPNTAARPNWTQKTRLMRKRRRRMRSQGTKNGPAYWAMASGMAVSMAVSYSEMKP